MNISINIVDLINTLKEAKKGMDEVSDYLKLDLESKLTKPFYSLIDDIISNVDNSNWDNDWLAYFIYDCDAGDNPMLVTLNPELNTLSTENAIELDSTEAFVNLIKQFQSDK